MLSYDVVLISETPQDSPQAICSVYPLNDGLEISIRLLFLHTV